MKKLNEVDKAILRYNNISYIIEAYKIFYGEYPNFEERKEQQKMQLMMLILTEYKIENMEQLKDIIYNEHTNMPFSNTIYFKNHLLEEKIARISDKEKVLEQICDEKPISESAQKDIKVISYMIKQQIEKEEIKDPIEFLKQLCNILFYRRNAVLSYCGSYEEQVDEMVRGAVKDFEKLGYQYDIVEERIKFIISKLKLFLKPQYGNCSTELIFMKEKITVDDLSDYSGILSEQKDKVLTK